jgi:hypothetical protein
MSKGMRLVAAMPAAMKMMKASGWVRMPQAGIHAPNSLGAGDVLHVERAVYHDHPHDGGADGDLRRDHEGGCTLATEEGVVVGRRPARHHEPVHTHGQHGEHVEDPDVQGHRLELDLPPADHEPVAEGDRGEADEGEEHRHERRPQEQGAVGPGGHEVFLGEHLDGVGERMQQAEDADAEDRGAVGADPVLHDGGLLSLHPGQEPAEVEHHEHDEGHGDGGGDEVAGQPLHQLFRLHAFTIRPVSPSVR